MMCPMSEEHDDFFNAVPSTKKRKIAPMTIEAKIDETNKLLAAILAALATGNPVATPGQHGAAATPGKPPAEKPAAAGIDYDRDIKERVKKLAKDKGREAVGEVLKEFKVDTALKVDQKEWPKLIEKLQAAIDAPATLA